MIRIMKKTGKTVCAYKLGEDSYVEELIARGQIRLREDGMYEVFSQEAVHGKGELARPGDFVKLDSKGFPYPNSAEFFHANHRWISGNTYEQQPVPLEAWTAAEPMCDEIRFLIREKGLQINENDRERYFTAPLWGTIESAGQDAVIVFYCVSKAENGEITNVEYNFVAREEFEKTYVILDPDE